MRLLDIYGIVAFVTQGSGLVEGISSYFIVNLQIMIDVETGKTLLTM